MLAMMGPTLTPMVVVRWGDALQLYSLKSVTAAALATDSDGTDTLMSLSHDLVVERRVLCQDDGELILSDSRKMFMMCNICEKLTKDKFSLRVHQESHRETEGTVYKCVKCLEIFLNEFTFQQHSHGCKYQCNRCDFSDVRKRRVEQHVRAKHKFDHLF